jgi:hypothetical protein
LGFHIRAGGGGPLEAPNGGAPGRFCGLGLRLGLGAALGQRRRARRWRRAALGWNRDELVAVLVVVVERLLGRVHRVRLREHVVVLVLKFFRSERKKRRVLRHKHHRLEHSGTERRSLCRHHAARVREHALHIRLAAQRAEKTKRKHEVDWELAFVNCVELQNVEAPGRIVRLLQVGGSDFQEALALDCARNAAVLGFVNAIIVIIVVTSNVIIERPRP